MGHLQYGLFFHVQDYGMLEETVKSVVETYQEFHVTEGKKVRGLTLNLEFSLACHRFSCS